MKLRTAASSRSQHGSALVIALVIGAVIGIVLASFLSLVKSRMLVRARSFAWNSAVPILEAGIEEAFTHLKDDGANLTANQWSSSGTNGQTVYSKRRDFSDGSYCLVTISNVSASSLTAPIIYSQGFVRAPLSQRYISRQVQVSVGTPATFTKAIAAKNGVTLSSSGYVDSFDSSNTNYSTGGMYDPAKRRANGDVVTNSKASPAVDVGNGHIYGKVNTGPGGVVTIHNGSVGDLAWSGSNTGIETGYANNDMNVTYSDPTAPAGSGLWVAPLSGNYPYGGTNYTYQLGNVNNTYTGSFSMSGGATMVVTGNATLYVTDGFSMTGNSYIYIAPGGSLQLYVGGATTSISGGGILNGTGVSANFSYYGLAGNTTVKYSGNSAFIGTINAPEADFTYSGGSDIYGAAIVNSFTSKSSGAGFHYDETLGAGANVGAPKLYSYREF
jgi:hypothetical protein